MELFKILVPNRCSTGTGAVTLENNGDAYFFTASSYGTDVATNEFWTRIFWNNSSC